MARLDRLDTALLTGEAQLVRLIAECNRVSGRPVAQWTIDPQSGRPVCHWTLSGGDAMPDRTGLG